MADPSVDSVRASAYDIPTDGPEADGTLAWDHTTLVVVEVVGGGLTGTGWTYAPRAAVAVVQDLLAPVVAGRSALAVEMAWEAMVRAVRNAGRPGLVGMALSAVDIALWDLAGRLHDMPLTSLWDDPATPVEVYGSGGFTTYDDQRLREQLEGWLALGCSKIKIKIGESWGRETERDLDRVTATRNVVGDDVAVFVDANGGYDVRHASVVGSFLDTLGVAWFEEPVSSQDHDGLDRVRAHVRADVAAGEYGSDLASLVHLAPHVDCLQLDVTRCGGYTEWRRIVSDPRLADIELSGHCAPYVSLPAAATTARLRHVEYFHDHVRIAHRFFDGCPDPVNGMLSAPGGPGHGLTFRACDAQALRVA